MFRRSLLAVAIGAALAVTMTAANAQTIPDSGNTNQRGFFNSQDGTNGRSFRSVQADNFGSGATGNPGTSSASGTPVVPNGNTSDSSQVRSSVPGGQSFNQAQSGGNGGARSDYRDMRNDRADIRNDNRDIRNDRRDLAGDRADLRQDNRDINHDRRDLANDYRERSRDMQQLRADERAGNHAGVARDRAELRQDNRDINRDRQDLHRDYAERNRDMRDMRGDRRELRHDYADRRNDYRDLRNDRREGFADHRNDYRDRSFANHQPGNNGWNHQAGNGGGWNHQAGAGGSGQQHGFTGWQRGQQSAPASRPQYNHLAMASRPAGGSFGGHGGRR